MYDLFWFYMVQQLRRAAIAAGFGFLTACALFLTSSAFYDFALLSIGGAFGLAWPAIVMTPMMNFQWMATLPLSRVQLMITRSIIVFSGMSLMGIFYGFTHLLFVLTMPRPKISMKTAEAAAKLLSDVEIESSSFSLTKVLGDNPVYMFFLALTLLGFAFLLLSVSSMVVGAQTKSTRQSGSPWWHPVKRIRIMNWSVLIGGPVLLLALAPLTNSRLVAALNFSLLIAYLVFTLGNMVALHGRVPKQGTRRFLLWLGSGNAALVLMAFFVSWLLRI